MRITPDIRAQVLALRRRGRSISDTARELGISKASVKRLTAAQAGSGAAQATPAPPPAPSAPAAPVAPEDELGQLRLTRDRLTAQLARIGDLVDEAFGEGVQVSHRIKDLLLSQAIVIDKLAVVRTAIMAAEGRRPQARVRPSFAHRVQFDSGEVAELTVVPIRECVG